MPGKHAKLAPSSSKRWLACTASPHYVAALVAGKVIVESPDSVYSIEGTEAHDWASKVLEGLPLKKVPEDFRPHIGEYVHVCRECEKGMYEPTSHVIIEGKLPLFYSPGETGTVDYGCVRVDKKGRLEGIHIRDLKYGKGVPVDADENTQLAIYAMSLIVDLESWWGKVLDHTPITIGIHQPRYTGEDTLKVWETTAGDLREFCKPITKTARRIDKAKSVEELEFAPSAEVCQFCPAKAVCKARAEATFDQFPEDVMNLDLMSNLDLPDVESVIPEQLVAVYRHKKDIISWLEGAEEHLLAMATSGHAAPGTKLVAGRQGNREWRDEDSAAMLLRKYLPDEEVYTTKVIGPAPAEKALKEHLAKPALEAHMAKLTTRSDAKEVLALEDDKRPAIEPAVKHFTMLTDEQGD